MERKVQNCVRGEHEAYLARVKKQEEESIEEYETDNHIRIPEVVFQISAN